MALQIGIVGLPNVGKSTLFQALTRTAVPAENFPFCTIDPNVGVVAVPDERLEILSSIAKTQKTIPTTIEFVDIAGLVAGAHKGEGLGNQFLQHIREVNAIAEVVRVFSDPNVIHVAGSANPESDMETIHLELVMADMQVVEKLMHNEEKKARGQDKEALAKIAVYKKLHLALAEGKLANTVELTEDEAEIARTAQLLTSKPFLIVANVDEGGTMETLPTFLQALNPVAISAKIEAELSQLPEDEAVEYMKELGMKETGLSALIRRGYETLNLITYFTAGEKEVRAWTVHRGACAPEAAGVIHSDFEKGFIRAEVVSYADFVEYGGWSGARTSGKVRMEGKTYTVKDGDVMLFHHN
ncbi:MAG: redox-regulated ATPase YchF [Candidatus Kerfeldbacteria bacterium]|nr:redox-regulated ATPase YchF [Candidatus Kerfeldbacteria bacterium]